MAMVDVLDRPPRGFCYPQGGLDVFLRFLQASEATEPVVDSGEGGVLSGAEGALQPPLCD